MIDWRRFHNARPKIRSFSHSGSRHALVGAASSFAEADKFACQEWAIGYASGAIFPTEAYRNQKFQGRSNER
jgi:hypothetical protein